MAILNKSFRLVHASQVDASSPKLVPLTRAVATELALLAILVPFAVSNLAATFIPEVFCTYASLAKGAYCSAEIDVQLARTLWSGHRSKGAFHRLQSPLEALAKRLGLREELPEDSAPRVGRPLAFAYDFLEIFSGAAVVSDAMASLGFVVGPPIDLSLSFEFNMEWAHVISWLSFLISTRRVKSFMVSPPCTTFSIMRRPALRSKQVPHGFDPSFPQTSNGNLLVHRGLHLMHIGWQNKTPGLFETPWSALLKHLPSFQNLVRKPGVQERRTDSCMFGSIHQKSFRLVSVHMDLDLAVRRCDSSHDHVRIEGAWTKSAATYVPELAMQMAKCPQKAIRTMKEEVQELGTPPVRGHESQLVNAVALTSSWKTEKAWTFRRPGHINVLEMSVLAKLAADLSLRSKSLRVSALVDSFVCSAATSKGRSSSVGLSRPLRRFCAISVAAFLLFCNY